MQNTIRFIVYERPPLLISALAVIILHGYIQKPQVNIELFEIEYYSMVGGASSRDRSK